MEWNDDCPPPKQTFIRSPRPFLGIDLGTTSSLAGLWQNNKVVFIPSDREDKTFPSCITFANTRSSFLGRTTTKTKQNDTVTEVKRLIGRKFDDPTLQKNLPTWPFEVIRKERGHHPRIKIQGKILTPEEISSMVLKKIKKAAENFLGDEIKDVVISVPASFNVSQRQATKDAGILAGFNVLRLITEPIAAAISYCLNHHHVQEKEILVFDLGGGTCDATLLVLEDDIIEMKYTAGNTWLGGVDFDNRLVKYFIDEIKIKYDKDISGDTRAIYRLKMACEKAKIELSTNLDARVSVDSICDGIDFDSIITREKFEELNLDLFLACLEPIRSILQYSKTDRIEVEEVILVGGSTRIPKIQEILQDFFKGKEIKKLTDIDGAVAYLSLIHI
eukprot:TRINITY_DN4604_c0_g2_i2.p1 TRINITY_DN4604_c0_g2~~TRINITY_DN4604_c0_g2_i2.p1  ORF type:complete len:389 (+),score=82.83 TRINITY_DN4604_c0_g2_i2:67-1233(+)